MYVQVPRRYQQYVSPTHLAERAFEEERRRTQVIPHLCEEGSLLQLVLAVLIRARDRWRKKQFSAFEQQQVRALRCVLGLDQPVETASVALVEARSRRSAASAG